MDEPVLADVEEARARATAPLDRPAREDRELEVLAITASSSGCKSGSPPVSVTITVRKRAR